MNWKTKIVIGAGVVLVIAALLLILKWQNDIIERQKTIEASIVEMKKLPGDITRSETKYVTSKDLENFAKELDLKLGPIKDDLKKLNGDIKAIQVIRVVSSGYTGTEIPSTDSIPRPNNPVVTNNDPHGYQKSTQVLDLNEPFSNGKQIPWGQAKFSSWREKPWDLDIKKRDYRVVNVLGQDEEGRHYVYSRFSIEVDGKEHKIDISEAKMVEEYPSAKFSINPNLYLGIDGGVYLSSPAFEATPNIQLALFSYGKTKKQPDWTFFGLGVGYEVARDRAAFIISPANYNVANHLPLVNNLYIGPTVAYDTAGDFAIMAGVRVGL